VEADPRFTLLLGDAIGHLRGLPDDSFDVVIFDLPDMTKETAFLYSAEVFADVARVLTPQGTFGSHCGSVGCTDSQDAECRWPRIFRNMLKKQFGSVSIAGAPLPTFGIIHGFIVATNGKAHHSCEAASIDSTLGTRVAKGALKFYAGASHEQVFQLPAPLREFLTDPHDGLQFTSQANVDLFFADTTAPTVPQITGFRHCSCDFLKCDLEYEASRKLAAHVSSMRKEFSDAGIPSGLSNLVTERFHDLALLFARNFNDPALQLDTWRVPTIGVLSQIADFAKQFASGGHGHPTLHTALLLLLKGLHTALGMMPEAQHGLLSETPEYQGLMATIRIATPSRSAADETEL